MTLRHIVFIAFPEDADPAFLDRLDQATAAMVAQIPEVLAAAHGRDLSGSEIGYALSFDFADDAAYQRYRVHPAHQDYIRYHMRAVPMTKSRARIAIP